MPYAARSSPKRKRTDLIVIHCSATPSTMDIGAAEIDQWHRKRRFREVGYHFVVRRNGRAEAGRGLFTRGAHARGFNDRSLGVCLVGGVSVGGVAENNFTPKQMSTLWSLLGDLAIFFPEARVVGHGDLPRVTKACPSFNVADWLNTRRPA